MIHAPLPNGHQRKTEHLCRTLPSQYDALDILHEQAYHTCVTYQHWSPGRMAAALALGEQHSCALLMGGGVACWGYNFHGQLGIGSTLNVGFASQLGVNMQLVALDDGGAALHVASVCPVSSESVHGHQ